MRPLSFLVFGFLFLFEHQYVSANTNKFILVYKKQSAYGHEQVSLVLRGDELRLTSNTNLWKEKFPYYYGVFSRKISAKEKIEIQNLLNNKEIINVKTSELSASIHSAKLLLNDIEIIPDHKIYISLIMLLKNNIESKKWKKEKGVVLKNTKDFLPIRCSENEKKLCIFEFGFVHL